MSAKDLGAKLVETVLAERPEGASGRAAVLINGLGATKYEELFVLYGHVSDLLADAGVELIAPEVGELVTSLDMAGCSLSVTWLDEELERYWVAPADTPAFRRGDAVASERFTTRRTGTEQLAEAETPEASEDSIAAAAVARKAVDAIYATVEENKEYLGQIDAIAGDGDHGIGMSRGSKAAAEAAKETQGGVETVLAAAGHAFGDKAGGTSGILWGVLLEGVGKGLGNTEAVTSKRLADAVQESAQHLQRFSKASLGDKTMLDALFPFVDRSSNRSMRGVGFRRVAVGSGRLPERGRGHRVTRTENRAGAAAGRAQRGYTRSGRSLARPYRYRDRRGPRGCAGNRSRSGRFHG